MTELEFVQQARFFADYRGYKPSWVYVVFKERYGRWPEKLLKEGEPMQFTDEFLEWVFAYWQTANLKRTVVCSSMDSVS